MPDHRRSALPCVAVAAALVPLVQETTRVEERARLVPPESGPIHVAFVLSPGATMIDFAGPWEVFQDVTVPGRGKGSEDAQPFRLYTVAESREPVVASGGMRIVPDYAFEDAPAPRVVVVPAQQGSPGLHDWLRKSAATADLTMSVCTGSFHLAAAGLLDGRRATTHHEFQDRFARAYPQVRVERGPRWVEGERIATAGGLTSGVDLALRVVARYFGEPVAERTARYMEYTGQGWHAAAGVWDGTSDEQAAAEASVRREEPPLPALRGLDPVVLTQGRQVPGRAELVARHGRHAYAFESEASRAEFGRDPQRYAIRFDGACAFMARSGAAPGSGDPDRFLVHEGRVYVFASEACREGFAADPARYADVER